MKILFKGWQWVGRAMLLLALVAVTVWLGQRIQLLRTSTASLNDTLAKLPEMLSAEAAQQAALTEQKPKLERLQRLLPRREEVGVVAGALERAGAQRTLAVVITDLREAELKDASGTVVTASGPLRDIRITGVATGGPAQLLSWLAAAEQLPYLMRLESWTLRVIESTGASGTSVVAPTASPVPAAAAELAFTFLLSIRYAE